MQCENRIVKKHTDVLKPRQTPLISLKKEHLSSEQRELLLQQLARKKPDTDLSILPNPPVIEQNQGPEKPLNHKSDTPPAPLVPAEPQSRPCRMAKTEAVLKMKGMQ